MFVVLMFAMAQPGTFESVTLAAGSAMFAGFATFFSTFVYGPLSLPWKTMEGFLARVLLAFLGAGLIVVGSAAVRSLFTEVAGAA